MWQYRLSPNTLADGDIATGLLDSRGNLKVTLLNTGGTGSPNANVGDAQVGSGLFATGSFVWNGATWDRSRSMTGVTDAVTSTGIPAAALLAFNGSTYDRLRVPIVFKAINGVAIGAEATVWTPGAGKKFRLMGFMLAVDTGAGQLTLRDNTAGTIIWTTRVQQNVALITPPLGNGILSAAANNVLTATSSVANNLTGIAFGTEE